MVGRNAHREPGIAVGSPKREQTDPAEYGGAPAFSVSIEQRPAVPILLKVRQADPRVFTAGSPWPDASYALQKLLVSPTDQPARVVAGKHIEAWYISGDVDENNCLDCTFQVLVDGVDLPGALSRYVHSCLAAV